MRPTPLLAASLLAGAIAAAPARAAPPSVVVELFTSQGCSSCPPADALLLDLARQRPEVLALAFHVTYWNGLGWRDPFSLPEATERQKHYAATLGGETIYTPQMVVDGKRDVIGSDRPAVQAALREASARAGGLAVPVTVRREAETLVIDVPAGHGAAAVLAVGYDPQHQTSVARGENGGRTLTEANIVRAIAPAGDWTGAPLRLRAPAPAGAKVAVLLQAADGRIIGAGRDGD
jgi:hypothetical protein